LQNLGCVIFVAFAAVSCYSLFQYTVNTTHFEDALGSIFNTMKFDTNSVIKSVDNTTLKILTEINVDREINANLNNLTHAKLNSIIRMIGNLMEKRDDSNNNSSVFPKFSYDDKDWTS
jgi:hypothetical protein